MQLTTTLLTLLSLASSGLVAAVPGGGWNHWTSSCWTSSTCSAVYKTKTKTSEVPYTTVVTTTVYKPETKTTEIPTTIYKTYSSKLCSSTCSLRNTWC